MDEEQALKNIIQNIVNALIVNKDETDMMVETFKLCKLEFSGETLKNYGFGYADGMARGIEMIVSGQLDITLIKKEIGG